MKKLAGCLAVVLLVSLLMSCGTSYAMSKNNAPNGDVLSSVDGDENTFYLPNASPNIFFSVLSTASVDSPTLTITDSTGSAVLVGITSEADGLLEISPPAGGYLPGERYTLSLGADDQFANDAWKNVRTLIFCIEKDAVEEYTYTSTVNEQASVITKLSENIISTKNMDIASGDILMGKNGAGEYVAYKVNRILDNGRAEVSAPDLDEIFADLNVYGDYEMDVSDLVINPGLEAEMIENIIPYIGGEEEKSAYAADDAQIPELKLSVEPDEKNNILKIEIKIILPPSENGLFGITGLKDQRVTITLKASLWCSAHVNIQDTSNWDASTTVRSSLEWNVEIDWQLYPNQNIDGALQNLILGQPENSDLTALDSTYKRTILDKLESISAEERKKDIDLFKWELPIPAVPGLKLFVDVKLFYELKVFAKISVGQEVSAVYTIGLCILDGEYKSYSSKQFNGGEITASFGGKANLKCGLQISFGVSIIDDRIASVKIKSQLGFYTDIFATVPLSSNSMGLQQYKPYFYFEPGIYYEVLIEAHINLVVTDAKIKIEIAGEKYPFEKWTYGDWKIPIGISPIQTDILAVEYYVAPPEFVFEYYDVKTGAISSEIINTNDITFLLNDDEQFVLNKDGYICLPDSVFTEQTLPISALYTHSDGQAYGTTFEVILHNLAIETPYFIIRFPQDWGGKYSYALRGEDPDDFRVYIYEYENRIAGGDGLLATICLYHADEDYDDVALQEYKDRCKIDGNLYDIVVIHPTDVRFIEPDSEGDFYMRQYLALSDDLFADWENEDPQSDYLRIIVNDKYLAN